MKTIVLTGPDGTGKSTLCKALCEKLPGNILTSSAWETMNLMSTSNSSNSLTTKESVQNYLKISDQTSRIYFLFHAIARSEQQAKAQSPNILLLDGYWYKYAVAEMARGGNKELILKTAGLFAKPDLVLFLDIEPAEALKRKKQPSAYESGGATQNFADEFLKFQSTMYNYWKELSNELKWTRINSQDSLEAVEKNIMDKITHELNR